MNRAPCSQGSRNPESPGRIGTVLRRIAWSIAVATAIGVGAAPVHAESPDAAEWGHGILFDAAHCAADSLGANREAVSAGRDCGLEGIEHVAFAGARYYGHKLFGERFRLVSQQTWRRGVVQRDVDAVIPVSFASNSDGVVSRNALFIQSGLTSWTDRHAERHDDARTGAVYRFALSEDLSDGVLGVMTFLQQDLATEHQRAIAGVDYATGWMRTSYNVYTPITGWKTSRLGYEQRPLAGVVMNASVDLADRVEVTTSLGRWENTDASAWDLETSLGLSWSPCAWCDLSTQFTQYADEHEESRWTVRLSLPIPFGGTGATRSLRSDIEQPDEKLNLVMMDELWRPVEGLEPIRYADRIAADEDCARPGDGVSLRFIQSEADSGGRVGLEAQLADIACEDTVITARLVPGDGENPAVPGEDYEDEDIDIEVSEGQQTGRAYVTLLLNPDNTEGRSLGAQVVSY